MKTQRLIGALAATAAVAALVAGPAAAASEVSITVTNGGDGSRTLFVEDLLGAPLTQLDFGDSRSLPFRVRVEDATMDREGFTVSSTMTNLYRDPGDGPLEWDQVITSDNLAIGNPINPLDVSDVAAQVQPVFDTVTTITDLVLCADLGLPLIDGSSCELALADVTGIVQDLAATVDLADLSNLPLLPQAAEPGAFTSADFGGVAADDPSKPATVTPTNRKLLGGQVVSTTALLDSLDATLAGVLAGLPFADTIDETVFQNALVAELGVLSTTQIDTILASPTVATVQNLLATHVLSQTGKYQSHPTLNITIPDGAPVGSLKGTLTVTAIQP